MQRFFTSLLVLLSSTAAVQAQTVLLEEAPLKDSHFRIELNLTLDGVIRLRDGTPSSLKQAVSARHEFSERVLESSNGLVDKSARFYHHARATLESGGIASTRTLRPQSRLMIADRARDLPVVYAQKALTQEEFELTEHFDTLTLPGLLPDKEVAVGATWKVRDLVAQVLCDLDGLSKHDLTCKLEKVESNLATVSVAGKVEGIDLGARVNMIVNASLVFDVAARRIISVDWKQSDQRDQAPASPEMSADVHITLKRTPTDEPPELNNFALVPLLGKNAMRLSYRDPQGRYELEHARDWHLTARTDRYLVLRLFDRGEFTVQATIMPWKTVAPGKTMTKDEFTKMLQTPGWDPRIPLNKEVEEVKQDLGYQIYRTGAQGFLDGEEVVQYFYLIADKHGHQVVTTFTMRPAQVQRLETLDLDLVSRLRLPEATEEREQQPQEKAGP